MEPPPKPTSLAIPASLFEVYLRLRPQHSAPAPSIYPTLPSPERFLTVEPAATVPDNALPTHITIHPPSDSRKRAVEKFGFTKVFEEQSSQLDIFNGTGAVPLVAGVLNEGRDGLMATLGVTGSGKSHTILGSKSQRGLTQLSLDLLFRSLDNKTIHPTQSPSLVSSLVTADVSEAQVLPASGFLDGVYGDAMPSSRAATPMRSQTPMTVGNKPISSSNKHSQKGGLWSQWSVLGLHTRTPSPDTPRQEDSRKDKAEEESLQESLPTQFLQKDAIPHEFGAIFSPPKLAFCNALRLSRARAKLRFGHILQDSSYTLSTPSRRNQTQRPSSLPTLPDISSTVVTSSKNMDYAILISMYEVYNDRIFDLLSNPPNQKDMRRRPLLFKSTEGSTDRKVVAGLRKIVCGTYGEAMMVLETGLTQRRVAGTGSNSVSSRSHGFFCVEVKKRHRGGMANAWTGAQLTVVDLAGSERARNAKTAGATLAEAGKINESLMYLGQCLQMQQDYGDGSKPSIVPFRQCKLTELLFSNSFPTAHHVANHPHHSRNAQKAVMIVAADPHGDFNATSQILRYSALAREVTVPRIPSVASIVFKDGVVPVTPGKASGRNSPEQAVIEEMETTVSHLGDEVEILTMRLAEETVRRREAEEAWQRAEEKLEVLEMQVREECMSEMESKLQIEKRRWIEALDDEADRNDEHMDRKIDLLTKGGIKIHEDPSPIESDRVSVLESENASLRASLDKLARELQTRSPTKLRLKSKSSSKTTKQAPPPKLDLLSTAADPSVIDGDSMTINGDAYEGEENPTSDALQRLEKLMIDDEEETAMDLKIQKTPGRKMRVLSAKTRFNLVEEEDDENWALIGTP